MYRAAFDRDIGPASAFPSVKAALDNLVSPSNNVRLSYYFPKETVLSYGDYICRMDMPWSSRYPRFLSPAFPKGSPYRALIHHRLMRHLEGGTLSAISERWRGDAMSACQKPSPFMALGKEKLVGLFALLAAGFAVAVALFLAEFLAKMMTTTTKYADGEGDRLSRVLARLDGVDKGKLIAEIEVYLLTKRAVEIMDKS